MKQHLASEPGHHISRRPYFYKLRCATIEAPEYFRVGFINIFGERSKQSTQCIDDAGITPTGDAPIHLECGLVLFCDRRAEQRQSDVDHFDCVGQRHGGQYIVFGH
jgi:hypothetical protein